MGYAQSPTRLRLRDVRSRLTPLARGNLIAGVTVAAYLVPQVMAYATVAGLPPITGVWAALPALLVYPLLGSSRVLSLGPESSVALMTAAVVAPLALGDPNRYVSLAAALAVLVGGLGLLAGLARVSFVSDLLSRPVLVGYMAGIGLLMIDGQLDALLGISTTADGLGPHLIAVITAVPNVAWPQLALATGVIVVLIATPRITTRLPAPLLALLLAAAGAAALAWLGVEVPLVGAVPQGVPSPALPTVPFDQWQPLLLGAAGVALVGFTDTVLTARAFRQRHETVDAAAELRAMSVGNVATGLLQGMPVSSSGSRTALARTSGARDQGYSLVVAAAVLVVLVVAGPVLEVLPIAGLAALVIFAAVRLIDVAEFRSLWRYDRIEFLLAVITAAAVLSVGILTGVLVAVGLSVLAMLARVARPHFAALGFVRGLAGMHDVADFDDSAEVPGLLIFRYDSRLFFANAQDFKQQTLRMAAEREPELQWVAFNCEAIADVDSTALAVFGQLIDDLAEAGLTVCLVRAKQELLAQLDRGGLLSRLDPDRVFPTLPTLVAEYRAATEGDQPVSPESS